MGWVDQVDKTDARPHHAISDWTLDMGNMLNTNTSGGELALLLTENNGGSKISSTRYIHYGTVTARSKRPVKPSSEFISTASHFQSRLVDGAAS